MVCFLFSVALLRAAGVKPGYTKLLIAERLDPVAMAIAPDGRIFLAEKDGRVLVVANDVLLEAPLITLVVDNHNERGLLGMTLDPHFEHNGYLYLYYTVHGAGHNRVSRFTATGNVARRDSEKIVLDLDPLPGDIHNGGSLVFGNDEKLYIAAGDGGHAPYAQVMTSLHGKILRIHPDGVIPADNPFYGQLEGKCRAIWAYGLRNPFSMAYDPATNRLLANDVGQDSYEEINRVLPGRNYGWPLTEGPLDMTAAVIDNYQDPIYYYARSGGCSVIGAAFYRPDSIAFPAEYTGKFFFSDYCTGVLSVLDPDSGRVTDTLMTGLDRPVALGFNRQGSLYCLQRAGGWYYNTSSEEGSLWKIVYTGDGAPSIGRSPAGVIAVVGENARFEVVAFGTDSLSYTWKINGREVPGSKHSTLVIDSVTPDLDSAAVVCIISNAKGSVTTVPAILTVTANARPVVTITTPEDGFLYRGGDTLAFSGTAVDFEASPLDAAQMAWKIDFHHDGHTHPAIRWLKGVAKGAYAIPRVGETSPNVWYRVYLTATDAQGLQQTTYRDYWPQLTLFTLQSDPPGLPTGLDGRIVETPFLLTAVAGTTRTLEAVATIRQEPGKLFIFEGWANGKGWANGEGWTDGAASPLLHVDMPATKETYTARYKTIRLGNGDGLNGSYYNGPQAFSRNQPAITRVDSVINFDWNDGSIPKITDDSLQVQWEGFVEPYYTDAYTFLVSSDHEVRLWVDNQQVVMDSTLLPAAGLAGVVHLEQGKKYPIRLDFSQKTPGASVTLSWRSTLLQQEIIPKSQLSTGSTLTAASPPSPAAARSKIMPNPFTGEAKVMMGNHYGETVLLLQDAKGRTITERTEVVNGAGTVVNLNIPAGALPGIYFLRIQSGQKREVLKVAKL